MLLQNKRIFIVEDNLGNRAIIQLILEHEGAKTAIDRWGTDAIERIKAFEPVNLILLDLMFPNGVSGFDIFNQIRANPSLNHIPVVAVSAMDPSEAIPKAQAMGFAGFLVKPIDQDTFVEYLVQIMEGEPVWMSQ